MTKSSEHPRCRLCAHVLPEKRESRLSPASEDFAVLGSQAELEGRFPSRLVDQAVLHNMAAEDVLAVYELPGSTRLQCSMKGRHLHAEGLVVRTACRQVLFLGKDCGRGCVRGFNDALGFVRRTREHHARIRLLEKVPELRDRVSRAVAAAARLGPLLAEVRALNPDFEKEMRERSRSLPRGTAVQIERRASLDGASRWERDTVHLRGLEIWRGAPKDDLDRLTRRAAALERELDGEGGVDAQSREYDQLSGRCIELEGLWRLVDAFFSEANLVAGLVAAHPSRSRDPGWLASESRRLVEVYASHRRA